MIEFPSSNPLDVDLRPEDGTIVNVGPYRHAVIWAGDTKPSAVLYCNACGSAFSLSGSFKPHLDPEQRKIYVCAQCHAFQGFVTNVNENATCPPLENRGQ